MDSMHGNIRSAKARLVTAQRHFRRRGFRAKRRFIIAGLVVVALLSIEVVLTNHHASPATKPASLALSGPAAPKDRPRRDLTTNGSSSAGARSVKGAADSTTVSAACRLLTLDMARQLLGAQTTIVAAGAADATTADIATTACAYANAAASGGRREVVRLVVHLALTPLGVSENGVAFGSGKPSHVTNVGGYGQTAYWNPSTGELNILAGNNWYVVSRQRGSSSAALTELTAVAKLIAPGLAK